MNKPDTVALRELAEHYAAKAREAEEIARRLRWWMSDAELDLRDGVEDEAAEWEETAEQLEWQADQAFRKLDRIETEEKEA